MHVTEHDSTAEHKQVDVPLRLRPVCFDPYQIVGQVIGTHSGLIGYGGDAGFCWLGHAETLLHRADNFVQRSYMTMLPATLTFRHRSAPGTTIKAWQARRVSSLNP